MATPMYLRANSDTGINNSTPHKFIGGNSADGRYTNLASSAVYWERIPLAVASGTSAYSFVKATVNGPTPGIEAADGLAAIWLSPPLAADVTISGSITFNLYAYETAMQANAAVNCRVMKLSSTGVWTQVHKTVRTTELGYSGSPTLQSWAETPTSTVFNRGDRIAVIPFFDDAGTMSSGYNCFLSAGGATYPSDVTFTETLTFEATPGGTTVYPTATGAGINPGSATEYEAWTSRGGGVQQAVTDAVTGPTNAIQVTASSGGTAIEWYTRQLAAMTLSGPALVHFRAADHGDGGGPSSATILCEIALCGSDGTLVSVWAFGGGGNYANWSPYSYEYLYPVTETVGEFWVAGDDLAITDGQRLRIRLAIEDVNSGAMSTTWDPVDLWYAGSAGATGDTYLTFSSTLTEYVLPSDGGYPYVGGGYYP